MIKKAIPADKTVKNLDWVTPTLNPIKIKEIKQSHEDVNALIAPILAARDISPDEVSDYLHPTMRNLLPDPEFFVDMNKAANRIYKAIVRQEKITIWTDYDVDGVTSAATFFRFLKECNYNQLTVHVPDRIKDGYGPNKDGLLTIASEGTDLLIILDSGTAAIEPLKAIQQSDMDVIVIDHHKPQEDLPPALAIVNPNRADQAEGYGHLCAVGMTFITLVAISLRLRIMKYFDGQDGRPEAAPDLMSYLDLVALGTICDVVPLKGLNKAFVARGLPYLSARNNFGIKALTKIAKCKEEITVADCGFELGPRINAAGRIGDSNLGYNLLIASKPIEGKRIAVQLDELNNERQMLTRKIDQEALDALSQRFSDGQSPGDMRRVAIVVVEAHEGVIGITASRVKDAISAPAVIMTRSGDVLKASARSVPGFDIGSAIVNAQKEGLIIKGGGHSMAGGFSIDPENVEAFEDFVNKQISDSDYGKTGLPFLIDAVIPYDRAQAGYVEAIQQLAPFGTGNRTPKIMIKGARMMKTRNEKTNCITFQFECPNKRAHGIRLEGEIHHGLDSSFANKVKKLAGQTLDLVGTLTIRQFKGRKTAKINIEDTRIHIPE